MSFTPQLAFMCHCRHAYQSISELLNHKYSQHPEDVKIVEGANGRKRIELKKDVEVLELTFSGSKISAKKKADAANVGKNSNASQEKSQNDWKLSQNAKPTVPIQKLQTAKASTKRSSGRDSTPADEIWISKPPSKEGTVLLVKSTLKRKLDESHNNVDTTNENFKAPKAPNISKTRTKQREAAVETLPESKPQEIHPRIIWTIEKDDESFSMNALKVPHPGPGSKNSTSSLSEIHHCSLCAKEYLDFKDFKEHLRVHFTDQVHKCPFCAQKLGSILEFKCHVEKCESENDKPVLLCGKCNKKCRSLGKLDVHLKSHLLKNDSLGCNPSL